MPVTEAITTRFDAFAVSLRQAGTIRSGTVQQAFASLQRHRCVPAVFWVISVSSVYTDRSHVSDRFH